MDTKGKMNEIKNKSDPSIIEVYKYIRYKINVEKSSSESLFNELDHWDKKKIENAIKEVERENTKPKPKRYYVSLKEPLEENF
ncbi:hypothetical protein HN789_02245 [archaeon]|jgi:hypothetical protein|nr:hypothetical protein [archaeon]MBT4021878.1 hypothetical protein [archaeon]MBT4272173.1 hypothetical protein [archaeon]MBT4460354.1 hypothetical protein [archaeon]MBT4858978.1 hypothetical protein [archaeon]